MKTVPTCVGRSGAPGLLSRTQRLLSLVAVLLLAALPAMASHFRFGLVTATRLSETSTTVTYRINVSESWRLGTAPGGTGFSITGGNSGSFSVTTTSVTDPSGGWTNASGSTVITLNKSATPTRIASTSCCKIGNTSNNAGAGWDEYIVLNTLNPGSSPVSSLPAIINMPTNAPAATYMVPATDPDAGSTLTYGVPSFTGGLAGQSNPSGFSVNPTTGQITMSTVGKGINTLWNAMVTVTDNHGNQIMLDFIIQIVGQSNPPAWDYSTTPTNGTVFNVTAGQNISFPLKAADTDPGSTVTITASGLPAFITNSNFSPAIPTSGNPVTSTFSWTPAAAQINATVVLNFVATDNVGVQTTTSVTIKVVAEPAPVFVSPKPVANSLRQIESGQLHQDNIVAQSSLGSNVRISLATIPPGSSLSPAAPTPGANPGQATLSWTPTPANWGPHNLSFTASIAAFPTIFTQRNYQLIVNTTPAFSSTPPALTINAGQPFSYAITVADPDMPFGDVVNIIAAGGLPGWLTLTPTGNGTALLSGTPTSNDGGTFHIHLEAEDIYHHGNATHVEQELEIEVITCVPPVIACVQSMTVNNDAGQCGAAVSYAATATGTDPVLTYSVPSGSQFPVGTTTVWAYASNDCGVDSCSFTVTVVDAEFPVINCTAYALNNDPGQCGADISRLTQPLVSDNCGVSIVRVYQTAVPGLNLLPIGLSTVTWEVIDVHGKMSSCNTTVFVMDTEPLLIECSAPIVTNTDAGVCGAGIAVVPPTVTDNCPVASVVGIRSDNLPLNALYPVGRTEIVWTATNSQGQSITCFQPITVTDNEAPVVTCRGNVNSSTDAGKCGASLTLAAPAVSDNCGVVSLTPSRSDGQAMSADYAVGTTTITWTVVDQSGNSSQCSQTVTVTDNEAPVITCGSNISVNNDAGKCGATVAVAAPAASDNCGIANTSGSRSDGQPLGADYGLGTTTITWTTTDIHGLSSQCSQTVTVTDNQAPVITCAANATVSCSSDASVASLGSATATDNCSAVVSMTETSTKGSNANAASAYNYTITRVWTATDPSGNSSQCTQVITVRDNAAPLAVCKPVTVTLVNGNASISAADVNGGSSDNCSPVRLSISRSSFNCTTLGSQSVTLTVTDVSGNSSSCLATVNVVGEVPTCSISSLPNSNVFTGGVATNLYLGYGATATTLQVNAPASGAPYTYVWSGNGLSSNSSASPVFAPTAAGTYSFSVQITNKYGCKTNCSISICVRDVRVPGTSGKKVYVCHVPPGNPGNANTLSISVNAVPSHLGEHGGDRLGSCDMQPCGTAARGPVNVKNTAPLVVEGELSLTAAPNPSQSSFRVQVKGHSDAPATLRVMNNFGKMMEMRSGLTMGSVVTLGAGYPAGIYYVEVMQEGERKLIKLIKQ